MSHMTDPLKAKQRLISDLIAEGFDDVRVMAAADSDGQAKRLAAFLAAGYHGQMEWIVETQARRAEPKVLWPEAQSIVMVAMRYSPEADYDPLAALKKMSCGTISCYAHNRDYHDVIKGKLKQAAGRFAAKIEANVKVFVDTAPVMEKPLAQKAGLGWQGKHTNLVSRNLGSWFFLGSIFTDFELPIDDAEIDHCGSCSACLDICPTNAFPAPYRLDARRCISYLTIEHNGPIPHEFREAMGNRIYGCDDCLAVCPWNKFAQSASETKLQGRADMKSPSLADLLALDDAAFRTHFSGSPVKRIGRDRFIRNCLIAAGNSRSSELADSAKVHLSDPNPMVRGAAIWAMSKLASKQTFSALHQIYYVDEKDSTVHNEWQAALNE